MRYKVKIEAIGHSSLHHVSAESKIEAITKAMHEATKQNPSMSIPYIKCEEDTTGEDRLIQYKKSLMVTLLPTQPSK